MKAVMMKIVTSIRLWFSAYCLWFGEHPNLELTHGLGLGAPPNKLGLLCMAKQG
jgi:hypothetical protein